MDLHVEKQCVEKMKGGNTKQFLMLFDAYFNEVYSYVTRRIPDNFETERVVRLTFLDALGQATSTPDDISYLVWLYSLAKPRAWASISKESFPEKQGLINKPKGKDPSGYATILERAGKLFKKLSLEEREIIRLKFCEQVTDGEVMVILGTEDAAIGPKIYRVLKRAHFLLFGESDERQGVYFGELSSFMGRVRSARKIEIPEAFKLSLRADLSQKIDQKTMAIEEPSKPKQAQKIEIKINREQPKKVQLNEFEGGAGPRKDFVKPVGSGDPAKIFVHAVSEMKRDDELRKMEEKLKAEQREAVMEFLNKWKTLIFGLPLALFLVVIIFVIMQLLHFDSKIPRNVVCKNVEVTYSENFKPEDKSAIEKNFVKDICKTFEASVVNVVYQAGDGVNIEVTEKSGKIRYELAQKDGVWQIVSYEKAVSRDKKPRKV